jgi:hypothetical protein
VFGAGNSLHCSADIKNIAFSKAVHNLQTRSSPSKSRNVTHAHTHTHLVPFKRITEVRSSCVLFLRNSKTLKTRLCTFYLNLPKTVLNRVKLSLTPFQINYTFTAPIFTKFIVLNVSSKEFCAILRRYLSLNMDTACGISLTLSNEARLSMSLFRR